MKNIILTLIILSAGISNLFACSCAQVTVQENIEKYADAVVVGTIISKKMVKLRKFYFNTLLINEYGLLVENIYKGNITNDTITIYSGTGGNASCEQKFWVGEKYIVYEKNESSWYGNFPFPKGENVFWTDLCLQTTLFQEEEITEIEKYIKPKYK